MVGLILIVCGGICQLVGFVWIVAEDSAERSRRYGEHGTFRRTARWLKYWLGPPSTPVELTNLSASASSSASLTLTVGRAAETELERLQRELGELRDELRAHRETAEAGLNALESRLTAIHGELSDRLSGITAAQAESRRLALRREMRATQLFMLGAVLSTAGAVIGT